MIKVQARQLHRAWIRLLNWVVCLQVECPNSKNEAEASTPVRILNPLTFQTLENLRDLRLSLLEAPLLQSQVALPPLLLLAHPI